MKKQVLCLGFLGVMLFSASAVSLEEFDGIVAFQYGLEEIYRAVNVDDMGIIQAAAEQFVILQGTVASLVTLDASEETFVGQVELVGGKWQGVEDVSSYRGYVLLFGPEFYGTVPIPRSRRASPNEIPLNSEIVVVAVLIDIIEGDDGEWIPVFQGTHLRR